MVEAAFQALRNHKHGEETMNSKRPIMAALAAFLFALPTAQAAELAWRIEA